MTTQSPFSNQSPSSPSTNQFGNTVAPGSGTEGLSVGLHDALYNYVQGSEFNGVMTSQWGLYTPMYLGVGQKLPAQASTGQLLYALADASNSVVWQVIYFGAVQQGQLQGQGFIGFPWLFIGGPSMYSFSASNDNCTSAVLLGLANSPSVVVPFAGDYMVDFGVQPNANSTSPVGLQVQVIANGVLYPNGGIITDATINNVNQNYVGKTKVTNIPAGSTITLEYAVSAGNVNFANRWVSVTPIRLAGV